ncbi:MAG: alpha/beta hydrolase [Gammaproteobacteria bacterium]|nr:alpha/beta hydrolase [Gammaproteobacteria bacterium]
MSLTSIEIEPNSPANASIIWLHGLGADGHDFEAIVPELKLPDKMAIRFIFPNAPSIPVTINNGYVMPAWYDILEMSIEREVDEVQLMASAKSISELIDREISRGIKSERIILAGFSQGGAVAYQTALTYPKPLAGLLGLSTYFATKNSILLHKANKNIPVQIYHGTEDNVVPELLGRQSYDKFKSMGYTVNYATYAMDHSVCIEEIDDISKWFQTLLE